MKKIILFLLCGTLLFLIASPPAHSQAAWKATGSSLLADADTVEITSDGIPDGVTVAIQATAVKLGGTLAGKVYLQHTLNGTDYITIDSLTLTNVSRSSKIFTITTTPAVKYKLSFQTTGTVSARAEAYIIRRRE